MLCPECGRSKVETNWFAQKVPYRTFKAGDTHLSPERFVSVVVPVRRCLHCKFEWTDWIAEELRDLEVKEAIASHQEGRSHAPP